MCRRRQAGAEVRAKRRNSPRCRSWWAAKARRMRSASLADQLHREGTQSERHFRKQRSSRGVAREEQLHGEIAGRALDGGENAIGTRILVAHLDGLRAGEFKADLIHGSEHNLL